MQPVPKEPTMTVQQLVTGDEAALETFLAAHADESMFLRANLRNAGLVYGGEPGQAIYAAASTDGRIGGVAAHCWNGMVVLQAPDGAAELAHACVAWSGRRVTGFAGPAGQVREARRALALEGAEAAVEGDEGLYALNLRDFAAERFLNGPVACRPPEPAERDLLHAWRVAYDIELLGAADTPETRERAASFLDAQIAAGNAWVAVAQGAPVSLSAFNAALPDIVQLGGIYTPPALRGRGFARIAVAASLAAARDRGVSRAVLFTNNPSAVRTYEAVGFRRTGDYSLVLLRIG